MFFLNLTAAEFLTLLGAVSGLVTALYLLDQVRRKKTVSTLRFWNPSSGAEQQHKRKRVREPWSLILQLASLCLLSLAIAQLEWGAREGKARDHVILLDTSSWTAQTGAEGSVLAREKLAAQRYIERLPQRDRVMLVRADALAVPATPFTNDRGQLRRALAESTPSFSALNIAQALSFAEQARAWSAPTGGEVVYVGPQLVGGSASEADASVPKLSRLRVIPVAVSRENAGIRSLAVKRSDEADNSWHASVTVKNYANAPRVVTLRAQFAGTVFAPRTLTLGPGGERSVPYVFVTDTAGRLAISIEPHDALPADDEASLELPAGGLLRVAAVTDRPRALAPLLEANRHFSVKFFSPAEFHTPLAADLLVLDQYQTEGGRASDLKLPSLWIDPPAGSSPSPVKLVVSHATIQAWQPDQTLDAGLHAKETILPQAEVFQTFAGDRAVASIAQGPVVVVRPARASSAKMALVGFDPLSGPLRYEITTPLLVANLLRWLSPEAFRSGEFVAGRVGEASVGLDANESASRLHVTDERGFAVPFTVREQTLELFANRPSLVHIVSEERDRSLSLTLPDLAENQWRPGENIAQGLPVAGVFGTGAVDLWRWLALLGGVGLLAEWLLFGRRRKFTPGKTVAAKMATAQPADSERELAAK